MALDRTTGLLVGGAFALCGPRHRPKWIWSLVFICPAYCCDNAEARTFLNLAWMCIPPSINLPPHWGAKGIVYIVDVIRDWSYINPSFGSVKICPSE